MDDLTYMDIEHRKISQLLANGKMLEAMRENWELTLEQVQAVYAEYNKEAEGNLMFSQSGDTIAENVFRYHRDLVAKYETLDTLGNPTEKVEYHQFLQAFNQLLSLKKSEALAKAPQLWSDIDGQKQFIIQAYYLIQMIEDAGYHLYDCFFEWNVYKIGYVSTLHQGKGIFAYKMLELLCNIRQECMMAMQLNFKAESNGIIIKNLPILKLRKPSFKDAYKASLLIQPQVPPLYWLQCYTIEYVCMDERIKLLQQIRDEDSESLISWGATEEYKQEVKRTCSTLIQIYQLLKYLIIQHEDAAQRVRGKQGDALLIAELGVLMRYITPEDMFAFSQAILTANNKWESNPWRLIFLIPDYRGKIVCNSMCECIKGLLFAEGYRQYYISENPNYRKISTVKTFDLNLRNACFDVYIKYRSQQIREELLEDNERLFPPTEKDILLHLLDLENSAIQRFETAPCYQKIGDFGKDQVRRMVNLFLQYLENRSNNIVPPSYISSGAIELKQTIYKDEKMQGVTQHSFFRINSQSIIAINEEWEKALQKRTKTGVIRYLIERSRKDGYFKFDGLTNQQKAETLNNAQNKYHFTESDFENANKPLKK